MITESGDLLVLAIQRKGEQQSGETVLAIGDSLLLQGTWVALDRHLTDPDVLMVDHPSSSGGRRCRSGQAPGGRSQSHRDGRSC